MSLKYEPSSEPLRISVKKLFVQVSGATDKARSALPVKAGSSADVPGERTPIPETRNVKLETRNHN